MGPWSWSPQVWSGGRWEGFGFPFAQREACFWEVAVVASVIVKAKVPPAPGTRGGRLEALVSAHFLDSHLKSDARAALEKPAPPPAALP